MQVSLGTANLKKPIRTILKLSLHSLLDSGNPPINIDLGSTVGVGVGTSVGVGSTVGVVDGSSVGSSVGVGSTVGVGSVVGVGVSVGTTVGSTVGVGPSPGFSIAELLFCGSGVVLVTKSVALSSVSSPLPRTSSSSVDDAPAT